MSLPVQLAKKFLPWVITAISLYFAFKGVDWRNLVDHAKNANHLYLILAIAITICSYCFRARRWQYFFISKILKYVDSLKVLILGFFMNNVLPARAGEFVRAHLGAKVTKEKRTLVLATIASERLADGVTISVLFVAFALNVGDQRLSQNLLWVAVFFGAAALAVIFTLFFRQTIFRLLDKLRNKLDHKASHYTFDRLQTFIHGLSPLTMKSKAPVLILWSLAIWLLELEVYHIIGKAYDANLPLSYCILFMVAVNFSSLIPAAPGGIGVIEVIATAVLQSIGIPKELALTMVLTQHAIQYLVIGIPGAIILLTWKGRIRMHEEAET